MPPSGDPPGRSGRRRRLTRFGAGIGVLLCVGARAALFAWPSAGSATGDASFVRDGRADFVVSQIAFYLGPDGQAPGICPAGMSRNVAELFGATPEGQRRPGESEEDYGRRLDQGGRALSTAPDGRNYCEHPDIAPPDPSFRTMDAAQVRSNGIDLDDEDSRGSGDAPRIDFQRFDGTGGVDNQFARVVGCSRSYQPTGQSVGWQTEMYTGSYGVLIRIEGMDDIRNDDDLTVTIVANADPIQLSPGRQPLDYATYAMDQDPQFRATTRGRLVDGNLTTEPVDIQLHHVVNGMQLIRVLRHARIQGTLGSDGVLTARLGGYTPIEAMYDTQFGFRNGRDAQGQLSRARSGSANGAARVLGYTCAGVYQALNRLADGDRDPASGRFTSVSTQYRIQAIPAFVVDAQTRSVNEVRNGS